MFGWLRRKEPVLQAPVASPAKVPRQDQAEWLAAHCCSIGVSGLVDVSVGDVKFVAREYLRLAKQEQLQQQAVPDAR